MYEHLIVPSDRFPSMYLKVGHSVNTVSMEYLEHGDSNYVIKIPFAASKFIRAYYAEVDRLNVTVEKYGSSIHGLYNCNSFIFNILNEAISIEDDCNYVDGNFYSERFKNDADSKRIIQREFKMNEGAASSAMARRKARVKTMKK